MFKISYKKIKLTSKHMVHVRLVVLAIAVLVIGGVFTTFAASTRHQTFVTISDPIGLQSSDSEKTARTLSTHTLPAALTSTAPTLKSAPSYSVSPASISVVTPAPTSAVPSLAPSTTQPTKTSAATAYQSTNWAGYLVTGSNYTSVSGNWVAPSPVATSSSVESADGTWIGIGGVTSSDLIQIGTENTVSPSGAVTTAGFYELLPAGAQTTQLMSVQPGDRLSASITQTAATQWTISMSNITSGQTFSKSVTYNSSFSSAEWIEEDPSYQDGSLVLLDNFRTTQFSNAFTTANGNTLSASAIGASPITLVGSGGATGHGASPGPLSGSSFVVSYY
jgi:hypothetical protein